MKSLVYTAGLVLCVLAALLLIAQSFVHENFNSQTWPLAFFWKLHLLKINDALMILVTLVGVVIAVIQLRVSAKPQLVNMNGPVSDSNMGLTVENGKFLWRASVKNTGTAGAVIRKVSFWVSFKPVEPNRVSVYPLNFDQAVTTIEQQEFVNGRDFSLLSMSPGAVIGSQTELPILEIGAEVISKLQALDVKLEYTGPLGGSYKGEIHCVPRKGITQRVPVSKLSNTTT